MHFAFVIGLTLLCSVGAAMKVIGIAASPYVAPRMECSLLTPSVYCYYLF
jgi:hypothetical protein